MVLQHIAVSQNIPKYPRVLFNDGGIGNDIDYPRHAVGHCMTQGKGEGGYCFPAAGGHLEAEVRNAGQYILIDAQRGRALLLPKEAEGGDIILGFVQQFQIAVQIGDDLPLIGFQFHVCRLLTSG